MSPPDLTSSGDRKTRDVARWLALRRLAVAAAVVVGAGGCGGSVGDDGVARDGAAAPRPGEARYGLAIAFPAGWHGRIRRGAVHAATTPLPDEHAGWAREVARRLRSDDAFLVLYETEPRPELPVGDGEFPDLRGPLSFSASDVATSDGVTEDSRASGHGFARRTFSVNGRLFVVFVEFGSRRPSGATLAGVNELLASLRVERGDFYPGTVRPAEFKPRPRWDVGTSGPDDVRADGEWVTAWAATVPYADAWNALPPSKTLNDLPRDGILIWVSLGRNNRFPPDTAGEDAFPPRTPPFLLKQFERRESWEGQVRDIPEYVLWGTVRSQYQLDLRVYFGQPDPSEEMLAEAQAMVDGLVLPDWGPWELE